MQVSQVQHGWRRLPFSLAEFLNVSYLRKNIKPNFYLCHTKKFKNSATQFSNLVSTSPSQCGRCQRKPMWRQSILSTLSLLWWALNTLIAYCIALKLELYDFTHSFIHYFQIRKRDSLFQYWKSKVADFGGTLSLFLGVSFFTILDNLHIVAKVFRSLFISKTDTTHSTAPEEHKSAWQWFWKERFKLSIYRFTKLYMSHCQMLGKVE